VSLPLAGVRVVDLTHFVAGPWCTMLLADLGADVVKIEPPGTGEIARRMGAVYAGPHSAIFLAFNRNKRSVALNLKDARGQAAANRLLEGADVIVQNFRPAAAQRLGMDAERLRQQHPRLVYCAISAFGRHGPYEQRPGNDPIIQALSGAMLLGRGPDERPIRMGVSLPDFGAGVLAALSILAALYRRDRTGRGALLELNLLDVEMFAQLDHIHRERLGQPASPHTPDPDTVLGLTTAFAARPHLLVRTEHPSAGPVRLVRTPVDATPAWPVEHQAPAELGQHTTQVLTEIGYQPAEIDELTRAGVIGEGSAVDPGNLVGNSRQSGDLRGRQ
jgi:crotonobetainyl-CoA:carnitine CoA-transferase CaiB-like acyl-CoA transferase